MSHVLPWCLIAQWEPQNSIAHLLAMSESVLYIHTYIYLVHVTLLPFEQTQQELLLQQRVHTADSKKKMSCFTFSMWLNLTTGMDRAYQNTHSNKR